MAADSWRDFLTTDALLPAFGWLVAAALSILGLAAGQLSKVKVATLAGFAFISIGVGAWYDYSGAQTHRDNRATSLKVDTLLALAGVPNGGSPAHRLDQLIGRNLRPDAMIQTQVEVLARAIQVMKADLPLTIEVNYYQPQLKYALWVSIQNAFERNGIQVQSVSQDPSTPDETGLMFSMLDPAHPPAFALRLRDAFGLAGVSDIRFVKLHPRNIGESFTIFVGPSPLTAP